MSTNLSPRYRTLLRSRLVAIAVFLLGGLLAVVLFVAAVFSHSHFLARSGLIAIGFGTLANAATWGLRAYDLLKVAPDQRPARARLWLTCYAAFAAIFGIAGGYLFWTGLSSNF